MASAEPGSSDACSEGDSPQRLEYPSAPLSGFDRPVEPVVRFAHGVRLAIRITYIVAAVMGLVFVVWAVLQLRAAFEAMGR